MQLRVLPSAHQWQWLLHLQKTVLHLYQKNKNKNNRRNHTYATKKLNFYTIMFNLLPIWRFNNNLVPKCQQLNSSLLTEQNPHIKSKTQQLMMPCSVPPQLYSPDFEREEPWPFGHFPSLCEPSKHEMVQKCKSRWPC